MSVSLSIKNVPDELAERLRARARRNRRSLQRELLTVLEDAAGPANVPRRPGPDAPQALTVAEVFERAKQLLPNGTPSSAGLIRAMRDQRADIPTDRPLRAAKRRGR